MGIEESELLLGAAFGAVLPYAITALVEWGQRHVRYSGHLLSRFGHRHRAVH